jgi:hypothetical protein
VARAVRLTRQVESRAATVRWPAHQGAGGFEEPGRGGSAQTAAARPLRWDGWAEAGHRILHRGYETR